MKQLLYVFDIDGTLTDTVLMHQKAFAESLVEIGVKTVNDDFNTFIHHTDSFIAKSIFERETNQTFNQEKQIDFTQCLTDRILKQAIKSIKGAKKVIDTLSQRSDVTIVYTTGAMRATAEYKLNELDIDFQPWQLVASDFIHDRKDIVSKAIQNAKNHAKIEHFDRIISLGDGLWDLKTAQALGIEFIGVGKKHKETLLKEGASVVIDDFNQFIPTL